MSPGGSIGLTPATTTATQQPGQSSQKFVNMSQVLNSDIYAQGPPPSSTPMLTTNTATNISSILGHLHSMGMQIASSVSHSMGQVAIFIHG